MNVFDPLSTSWSPSRRAGAFIEPKAVGLRQVATIIERARDRGEIAAGADVVDSLESLENLGGALIYRIFMLHRRLDAPAVERLVDSVLRSAG